MSSIDDMDSFTPTASSVQMSLLRYVREKKRGNWYKDHGDQGASEPVLQQPAPSGMTSLVLIVNLFADGS
ncbi:MAG: hypothetical protein Q9210_005026 [Variospora velana]